MTTAPSLIGAHDRAPVQCESTTQAARSGSRIADSAGFASTYGIASARAKVVRLAAPSSARLDALNREKGEIVPKRVLLRGGHVLSMDPRDRRHLRRRRPDRGRPDRRGRRRARGRRRGGHRRDELHRHPRLHRLAPSHLGDGDPRHRAGREPRRLLRHRARPARAGLPARGRVRRELPRLARGDRRRRDDAARLVAHQQHARACRRGDPRPARRAAARGLLLRQPEHVARRLVVHEHARGAGGHPSRPRPVLLERRRPAHARDGHAWPGLLHARGRPARLGARARRRRADQRARRNGALCRPFLDGQAARRARVCSARTRPTSTATTSPTRSSS